MNKNLENKITQIDLKIKYAKTYDASYLNGLPKYNGGSKQEQITVKRNKEIFEKIDFNRKKNFLEDKLDKNYGGSETN